MDNRIYRKPIIFCGTFTVLDIQCWKKKIRIKRKNVLEKKNRTVKDIITEILEQYYKEDEEYYGEYRYDDEENEFNMKEELEKALTEKGIKHIIQKEDGFSSPGYDNDFLAVAYIEEDGSIGLETVLLECM